MSINNRTIGYAVIAFSVILIAILAFVKFNYDTQSTFLCEVVSKNPDFDMAQCPAHKSNASWYITLSFGISFLILGIGLYLSFFSKLPLPETKKEFAQIDISKLDEEEKMVYNKLKEKSGSMYQSDLVKETGFTKVKITRILDKLETSGILERKRRGMANIVVLK